MSAIEVEPMARPKAKDAAAKQPPRGTIINLKGSPEQAEWLERTHRDTHLPKSVVVRLALALWAQKNGRPAFPVSEDD